MAKYLLVLLLCVLAACSKKPPQTNEAVKQAVVEHLSKRTDNMMGAMDMDVRSVSFRENGADAVVTFRPKGATAGGLDMNYELEWKDGKWVVKPKPVPAAGHGEGAIPSGGPVPSGGAMPPGHPPVPNNQAAPPLPNNISTPKRTVPKRRLQVTPLPGPEAGTAPPVPPPPVVQPPPVAPAESGLPNSPILNAPIAKTPIPNTPIQNAPISNTVISNTPISNPPISNTPIVKD